jgi:hypothetical protein
MGMAVITFAASVKGVVAAAPSAYPTPASSNAALSQPAGTGRATSQANGNVATRAAREPPMPSPERSRIGPGASTLRCR